MNKQLINSRLALMLIHVVFPTSLYAQAHSQGVPMTMNRASLRSISKAFSMPDLDNSAIKTYADSIAKTADCTSCKSNFYGKGIDVSIDVKAAGNLEVQPDPSRQVVRFIVTDNGIGIPAAAHTDIFRPFFQVDSGLTRHYEGTGLGLSVVCGSVH